MATQILSQTELAGKVRELKELRLMAAELEAEISTLEDAIKAEMTARDTAEIIVDVFKVRWTPVTTQPFRQRRVQGHPRRTVQAVQQAD